MSNQKPLAGLKFVVLGEFPNYPIKHDQLCALITDNGGELEVSPHSVDFAILGERCEDVSLSVLKANGISRITQDMLLKMIANTPKVKAKTTNQKPLAGLKFVVSGRFDDSDTDTWNYGRREVEKLILENGGKLKAGVTSKTDYLVAGVYCAPVKQKKAETHGVKIISEAELKDLINDQSESESEVEITFKPKPEDTNFERSIDELRPHEMAVFNDMVNDLSREFKVNGNVILNHAVRLRFTSASSLKSRLRNILIEDGYVSSDLESAAREFLGSSCPELATKEFLGSWPTSKVGVFGAHAASGFRELGPNTLRKLAGELGELLEKETRDAEGDPVELAQMRNRCHRNGQTPKAFSLNVPNSVIAYYADHNPDTEQYPFGVDEAGELPGLDPCTYDDWLAKGKELHAKSGGSMEGLKAWRDFSSQSDKYLSLDCDLMWISFTEEAASQLPEADLDNVAEHFDLAVSDPDHPYHELAWALLGAFEQAAMGKGKERHANSLPFTEQRMQTIAQGQGTEAGLIYQANKKSQESAAMDTDAAVRELSGAIVYLAGAIIFRQR